MPKINPLRTDFCFMHASRVTVFTLPEPDYLQKYPQDQGADAAGDDDPVGFFTAGTGADGAVAGTDVEGA
jgi:hypothetical protein